MKTLVASALILFSGSFALATEPEVLKTCNATVKFPNAEDKLVEETMKVEILKSGEQLISRVTKKDGAHDEESLIQELPVRADLQKVTFENVDQFDLNLAESLVVHAMQVTANPVLGSFMSVDFDLTLIRSAKVFMVGKPTNLGLAAIVEAKDVEGKVLGSYLGGFLVAPCK